MKTKVVFLHIPKTAGQSVHSELETFFGPDRVSPVRVHTQAQDTCFPDPEKYDLFSGHIDWHDMERITGPKYVFSVLRDPLARIASFYFYLQQKGSVMDAEELSKPEHTGLRDIQNLSSDDYFFPADQGKASFIRNHYDNFYTNYFAARRMSGHTTLSGTGMMARIALALSNFALCDDIFAISELEKLEARLLALYGHEFAIKDRRINVGPTRKTENPVQKFLDTFERDSSRGRIEDMAVYDYLLLEKYGISF